MATMRDHERAERLGETIRRQRELHELGMRHFAGLVGISNPYLSQIENGVRAPSDNVLEAIASALQMSAEALCAQAGLAVNAEPETSPVIEAIRSDPHLTGRQRQALIESYEAFVALSRRRRG